MITYSRIPDYYALLQRYEDEFPAAAAPLKLRGMLKDFQNLFVLDQVLNRLPDGGRLLEVGGGSCIMMRELNRVRPKTYDCWNLDPLDGSGNGPKSETHVGEGETAMRSLQGITIIEERIGDFSPRIEDEAYDCVFSVSVMEHIPLRDWARCFDDMRRVLKPGGFCIHAVDLHPLDGRTAEDRLIMLRLAQDGALKPIDREVVPSITDARTDPETLSASPFEYARWLRYMDQRDGPYRRVASGNSVYRKA
ncbi:MAG: methyltransferase domain-containing protein [Pseudomonadota bacterium]